MQKLKLYFVLLFTIVYAIPDARAQSKVWVNKMEDCDRLIVMLDDTVFLSDKYKQKKKHLIKDYHRNVENFNALLRVQVDKHWSLTPKIEYMSYAEVAKYCEKTDKAVREKTLLLYLPDVWSLFHQGAEKMTPQELSEFDLTGIEKNGNSNFSIDYRILLFRMDMVHSSKGELNISLLDIQNQLSTNFYSAVNCRYLLDANFVFALNNMQDFYRMKVKTKKRGNLEYNAGFDPNHKGNLSEKTLLVPRHFTVETSKERKISITEAEIKAVYPWKWKFATIEEIDEAVRNKDASKALLFCSAVHGEPFGYPIIWAVDAADTRTVLSHTKIDRPRLYRPTLYIPYLIKRKVEELVERAGKG